MNIQKLGIDKTWTLFLDRDGVINNKRDNDYVKTWDEFEFLPGVLDALKELSKIFGKIIIVTNQRGIAKGLYTEEDFAHITVNMLDEIEDAGGRIDWVFYCPHMGSEPECNCRKPKPGMGLKAKNKFPAIGFSNTIMVGDSASDIEFGKTLGMTTIQVNYIDEYPADFHFRSLNHFSTTLFDK
ncbi:MAG: HAD family hydrolase [Fimbriimonadaceae bacterium]|nr:HAD family hydrolase [Chitinophagales bacterium]